MNKIEVVQPRTKRQKDVLDYVTRFIERNGHKPSYQQIAMHLGVSSRAGIQRHIEALESQGLLVRVRENGCFRIDLKFSQVSSESFCNIEFIESTEMANGDSENKWSMLLVPKFMIGSLPPDEVLAFRMPDDSMEERSVFDRDIVLFEKRAYASRGDTVLAECKGGRMRVGRYYPQGVQTEIRPACSGYESVFLQAVEVKILGVQRGLMRPYWSGDS
ncbi:MAG: HTH domain-containing protein [Chloracidobacterium sp.]|nr:HTH domain-containing protein [Chloracidobacterium sp.]